MLSPEMYLLMLRYFYGITEAVVQRCYVKKLFLKIFKSHRKTPVLECRGLTFIKKRLHTGVFPSKFARFFRAPILYNVCEQLLLVLVRIGLVWRAAYLSIFTSVTASQNLRYLDAVFN